MTCISNLEGAASVDISNCLDDRQRQSELAQGSDHIVDVDRITGLFLIQR
jgi:hypothetical protein